MLQKLYKNGIIILSAIQFAANAELPGDTVLEGAGIVAEDEMSAEAEQAGETVHQPKLLLCECSLSDKELQPGGKEQLRAVFKNCSDSQTIYDLKVSARAASGARLIPGSFYFDEVWPGQEISVEGSLKVDDGAGEGMLPFGFEFEYENETGMSLSGREEVVLSIAEKAAQRKPQILLESCNLLDRELEAGSKEQMKTVFVNCSKSRAMYNVKVTVSADTNKVRISPISYYFSKIEAGEIMEIESAITAADNAGSGVVPLSYAFDYEDREGIKAAGQESVMITVAQPLEMELDIGQFPVFVYASETRELSVRAINLSHADAYNVRIRLDGKGFFPKEDVFLGRVGAGTEQSGVMRVYMGTRTMEEIGVENGKGDGDKYGHTDGTVTLLYEDEKGEKYSITHEIRTEIKKAPILSLEVEEDGEEKNFWQIPVIAAVIAGLAALAVFLLIRLRDMRILLEEARQGIRCEK